MTLFWTILATLTWILIVTLQVLIHYANRRLLSLAEVELPSDADWPAVTVIIPARNEQRDIEQALSTVLALDYEPLDILVIDDRSTDRTGEILDRMADGHSRLRVIHLTELPSGWLGKNHALQLGAEQSRSPFLLFTDADVLMRADTLRRAMTHVRRHDLDHLTISPDVLVPHPLLGAFVAVFLALLTVHFRLWRVADPDSNSYMGIGAFNLVRAKAYRDAGMHTAIAMRPDDDVQLGKLLKQHGGRQMLLSGHAWLSVRWYASTRELIRGLEKNVFAGVEYRVSRIVGGTLALFFCDLWPFIAPALLSAPANVLYAGTATSLLVGAWLATGYAGQSRWAVPLFPVAIGLLIFILWRSTVLTLVQGGIRWRDTFYSLAELRQDKGAGVTCRNRPPGASHK